MDICLLDGLSADTESCQGQPLSPPPPPPPPPPQGRITRTAANRLRGIFHLSVGIKSSPIHHETSSTQEVTMGVRSDHARMQVSLANEPEVAGTTLPIPTARESRLKASSIHVRSGVQSAAQHQRQDEGDIQALYLLQLRAFPSLPTHPSTWPSLTGETSLGSSFAQCTEVRRKADRLCQLRPLGSLWFRSGPL
jgi:hypothetical protein